MNEKLVQQAVNFLKHPNVQNAPKDKQVSFLQKKGLNQEEIDEAYKRVAEKPTPKQEVSSVVTSASPFANTNGFRSFFNQKLKQLPKIAKCRVLVVSKNELKELPEDIGSLQELEVLNAGFNSIPSQGLPESFFFLGIKELNLQNNCLTSLERFGQLTGLQKLNVANNEITEVPDEFMNLQELKFMWAQNNKISKVTPYLGLLSSLQQIVKTK